MKQHRYRITLEHLADAQGAPVDGEALRFEAGNHDDIFTIVEWMRARGDFAPESVEALAVGLKLFGGAMLANREHPLFSSFFPHFAAFMKELKKGPSPSAQQQEKG